jgi:hypothetical protein
MKRILCVLFVILAAAMPCAAQSMGTITEKGVVMEVKSAIALFDPERPSLRFMLFPDKATADDIAKIQAEDLFWTNKKTSPNPKNWPDWYPYAHFQFAWSFEKESLGNAKKASIFIYGYGISSQGSNMNINEFGDSVEATLTGTIKDGQEVAFTSKGSDKLGETTFSWDLNVKAKVLLYKKKK